ncbi:MAG: hypothetical protein H7Z42_04225 [Roseiflexaceae bacterium]|nr:hypothetical protein [Roseiflexaceae bacterium]
MSTQQRVPQWLARLCRHQGGAQTVEVVAAAAMIAALCAVLVAGMITGGTQIGDAFTNGVTSALELGGGGAATGSAAAGAATAGSAVVGTAPSAPITGPTVIMAQVGGNPFQGISSWFASLPGWLQGGIAAGLGALAAAAVIAAVAILVFTAPVWGTIGVAALAVALVAGAGALAASQSGLAQIDFWRFFVGGAILTPFVMGLIAASWVSVASGLTASGWASATTIANVLKTIAPFWPLAGALLDMAATGEWSWQKAGWALLIGIITLPISYVSSSKVGWIQAIGASLNVGLNQAWNFIRERIFGVPKAKTP